MPKLDEHAKSAEIFDVAKYPTGNLYRQVHQVQWRRPTEAEGTLTMHGVTKPVTLKINSFLCKQNPMTKKEVCGADATRDLQSRRFRRHFRREIRIQDGGEAANPGGRQPRGLSADQRLRDRSCQRRPGAAGDRRGRGRRFTPPAIARSRRMSISRSRRTRHLRPIRIASIASGIPVARIFSEDRCGCSGSGYDISCHDIIFENAQHARDQMPARRPETNVALIAQLTR